MRSKTSLVIIGAMLIPGILLSMQDKSIAGSDTVASQIGARSASVLTIKPTYIASEQHEEEHDHSHSDEGIAAMIPARTNTQPLRRVVSKAAASPAVAPKAKVHTMLAAIDQPDISRTHKEIANNVLMSLPPKCRNTLQHFYVKYEKQQHRGLAGKSVMILDGTVPDAEFRALFIHESGHNFDLGCLQGTAAAGKSAFSDGEEPIYKDDPSVDFYSISWITSSVQRSNSTSDDFVSGYASSDIFEDFAESFAYFILHNAEFAKRAQENDAMAKKYIWMRDVLFDGTVPHIAVGNAPYTGKSPWDITKLKYTWLAEQAVAAR